MARFLIVDDDEAVSETFARMLRFDGHDVEVTGSAEAGLASADRRRPDAIVLDVRMPGVGGLEFLRRLRAVPQLERVPVGIVTGDYFLKEDVMAQLPSLGAAIRYKPLSMADVTAFARELLTTPAGLRPVSKANEGHA